MSEQNPTPPEGEPISETSIADILPSVSRPDANALAQRIEETPGLMQKANLLWALPALQRHAALGALSAETIAALVETNPEENTALLGNLPATKFTELINLGAPEQGRRWLERAVASRMLAAQMLPAFIPSRDLMRMLMTSAEFRTSLSGLLNFRRAEEMRTLLHPLEWKNSLEDVLLADAEELLRKAPIRDRNIRSILQSLIDFYPELYLDVIRQSLEYAKYQEDRGEELADILEGPLSIPEMLNQEVHEEAAKTEPSDSAPAEPVAAGRSSTYEIIPTSGDPFLRLATADLPVNRRDQLEAELKDLLRREVLATGSFAQNDLLRAAGRLIFQIRAGLIQLGGTTPHTAATILGTKSFADIVLLGARATERMRQRSLQLSGMREWLDRHQRQFLTAMNTLEPGIDELTGEPALYLATRANQLREDYQPMPIAEVESKIEDIGAWASLARAAFGNSPRVQTILASLKTHTFEEALRRTVIALCLYRRWEPELINPADDLPDFKRQFTDELGRMAAAREVVLEALAATDPDVWRPSNAKERATALFMRIIDQMEMPSKPTKKTRVKTVDPDHEFSD